MDNPIDGCYCDLIQKQHGSRRIKSKPIAHHTCILYLQHQQSMSTVMWAHARIRIRCELVQCEHMRCKRMRSFASHANAFLMRHASIPIRYLGIFHVRYARICMRCARIHIACARIRIACARIACECAHLRGTYACPVLYPFRSMLIGPSVPEIQLFK